MVTGIAVLACFLAGVIWWYQLRQGQKRMIAPLVSFGPQGRALSPAERKVLIGEHLAQQRWAFGLAWFAVGLGIMLGAFLIERLISAPHLGKKELASTVGLAGDISLAGGAFKLYKDSAERLQEALKIALK